ncbi:bifunctional UDP-sugar hydrolase/5'-nucleotidase [Mesonia sp. K4-1]|uniref:bifunctional metallophosphatase/5'-nucleotidase n=1 Tax=Mesonia sp. K4-1 TaxID=2602760 RepID=UPI0011CBC164|nr:bifunctional metallophosphatase/5'-nucleotidase [Mesonia sp. K4-1]TXK72073.1 bifunctional metallophosphatase/5'-nucleotidase [Mesonia sp. K4-1]
MRPLNIIFISIISVFFFSCEEIALKKDDHTANKKDTVKISVLQTADIHGQLDTHPELFWENGKIVFKNRGGLAHIKTLFEEERAKNPGNTIIVDGGDLIQGSGYTALSKGAVLPEIIKHMNYDVLIPGNWEVVYGKNQMLSILNNYETPVIAQNMYHQENHKNLFPSHWIKEIDGVKLGFIGVNDPDVPIRQNPEFSKGIEFSGLDETLKEQIQQLKSKEKVDVLFLVTHFGIFKQVELANNPVSKEVDYILGNDTHERLRTPIEGKFAKVTEPGAFGSFVGKLNLYIVDGEIVLDEYELIDVDPEKYNADPKINELITKAKAPYKEEMEEIIGYTNVPLFRYLTVENPLDNMITNAAKWKTGVDIAISNGFRFGNPVVPIDGKPAPITKANLWNWLPVNEKIKTGKASGTQIKEWLEKEIHNAFAENATERFGGWLVRFAGMQVDFKLNAEKGKKINWIKVGGQPIQDDKMYSISACVRPGDPIHNLCRMSNVEDVEVKDYTIHNAVEDYLVKFSPVSPKLEKRSYCDDLGVHSFSTVPNTKYKFK